MTLHLSMNGQTVELEDRPRVIQDVKDDNLNELLASLAQKGAWVLSMERRGAVYTLQVSWRDQGEIPRLPTHPLPTTLRV